MRRWAALLLLGAAALVYFWRLHEAPLYLAPDEVIIANDAYAIAHTGATLDGTRWPLYVYIELSRSWFMPLVYYGIAAVLQVLPFAEWSIRVPTVVSALVSIVLCAAVARKITGSAVAALVAGVTLALAPAFFMLSRYALDYTYPVPFILGWLLCLVSALQGGRPRAWLFGAGLCLGFGWYSYISSIVMMPLYLLLTLVVLVAMKRPWREAAIVCAGFALMLLPFALWLVNHPTVLTDTLERYGLATRATEATAAVVQPFDAVAMLRRFTGFFKTDFLFRLGDTYLPFSTRTVGVFVPAAGVLMAIGLYSGVIARRSALTLLVLVALLISPLPASILVDEGAIRRATGMLPLAALLAGVGAAWLASIRTIPFFKIAAAIAGLLALAVGGSYLIFVLATQGRLSETASRLVIVAIVALGAAALSGRVQHGLLVLAPIVAMMALQFTTFQREYYGDYAVRLAPWLQGNLRGAVTMLMDEAERRPDAPVYFSLLRNSRGDSTLLNRWMPSYFQFYAVMQGRPQMLTRARFLTYDDDLTALPQGSVIFGSVDDPHIKGLLAGSARRLADVPEVDRPSYHVIVLR